MFTVEEIETRLERMTYSCVTSRNFKGNDVCRKIGKIVLAVRCGSSKPSRLITADKLLTEWGF